jgi:hypothetical protein
MPVFYKDAPHTVNESGVDLLHECGQSYHSEVKNGIRLDALSLMKSEVTPHGNPGAAAARDRIVLHRDSHHRAARSAV